MEVDASRQRSSVPIICRRCSKPGHIACNCPDQFDIRTMTAEERDDFAMDLLSNRDAIRTMEPETPILALVDLEVVEEEDF